MVKSNSLFKKQPGEKASDIAIKCLMVVILLNIIVAFIATLIPDNSFTLTKIFTSFSLFLLPALITVGNLRYIERYNLIIKIFSWASIAASALFIILGLVLIWNENSAVAIETTNNTPSSNLIYTYDEDDLLNDFNYYNDDDYDYYNYDYYNYDYDDLDNLDDYDYDYNNYNFDVLDDYDYNSAPSTYRNSSYSFKEMHITDFISPTLKIFLLSLVTMLSAFFIASCLKYKNYTVSIIGLKIASLICIAYCFLVAISFLLFPIPLNETAARFGILILILLNFGFYAWLALVIVAFSEKRKAQNNDTTLPEKETPASSDDAQTTTEPIPETTQTFTKLVVEEVQTTPEPTPEPASEPTPEPIPNDSAQPSSS